MAAYRKKGDGYVLHVQVYVNIILSLSTLHVHVCHVKTNGSRNFYLEKESFPFFRTLVVSEKNRFIQCGLNNKSLHPTLVTQVNCTKTVMNFIIASMSFLVE